VKENTWPVVTKRKVTLFGYLCRMDNKILLKTAACETTDEKTQEEDEEERRVDWSRV